MVRSLGVHVEDQVVPAATDLELTLGGLSVLVNTLSILIDIAPLFVLMVATDWKEAKKFFSVRGFAIGAIMNFIVPVHVLFVLEGQHLDVVFVSTVGFCLGTTYTFFLLGHRVVTDDRANDARSWMFVVLLCFVIACYGVFSGIFLNYKTKGYLINIILFGAVGILNLVTLYPTLICKPFPDQDTKNHTFAMCIFNTIDAGFFVYYAAILGSMRAPLSVVSLVNAACGVIQFISLVAVVLLNGLRKIGDYCRCWGDSCCGLFRLIAILFHVFGRHGRND